MKKMRNIFVSAVVITDEFTIGAGNRIKTAANLLKENYENYEILVIDNGLIKQELQDVKDLLSKVSCVRIVRLAKQNNIDTAIFAGIEAAIGDHICILYNDDPIELIPNFVVENAGTDIVFGVANNLFRKTWFEKQGTKVFYWYSRRYMHIDIPTGSTYYMCLNRSAANALTRDSRATRHIRHLANLVGFDTQNLEYELPVQTQYTHSKRSDLILKALDQVSGYSSHPIRALSYFGLIAAVSNLVYALYVVIVNLSVNDVARGWTTLSLQSSIMFFILFMIIAVLAEYIGKILIESRKEPAYHIMQELSSAISIADETRRNVTK